MAMPMTMMIVVEEIAFGRVFRKIDAMPGVIAINIKGDGPKHKDPKAAKTPSKTVANLLLEALDGGVTLHRAALQRVLVSNGKAASTLNNALGTLVKKKAVKTDGAGNYTALPKKKGK